MLSLNSLKHKFVLISFLCVVPTSLVIGILVYEQERRIIEEGLQASMHAVLQSVSRDVLQELNIRGQEARLLAAHSGLIEAIGEQNFARDVSLVADAIGLDLGENALFVLDEQFSLALTTSRQAGLTEAFSRGYPTNECWAQVEHPVSAEHLFCAQASSLPGGVCPDFPIG